MRHSSASEQPANTRASSTKSTWASPLLDQVALHSSFLPAQVVAKVDATVSAIASVTLCGAPFINTGQFALSGATNLVINSNLITQPATTDTYVKNSKS
ncbi:MAG: hypothetical protein H0Z27_05615 [Candidatus Nitrotoga sp.]|nr:hypothetical protein [Candidatus Nitrotoga sp.]MBP0118295.1 hypothetical protein [Candidatus Nitrotoga sp.]